MEVHGRLFRICNELLSLPLTFNILDMIFSNYVVFVCVTLHEKARYS